jgi:hypothetical protein
VLRRLGFPGLAEAAPRELPDPVDADQLVAWSTQHGFPPDDLISQMGGIP